MRKSPVKPKQKCKAPSRAVPPEGPAFTRSWCAEYLSRALSSANVPSAASAVGVTLLDVLRLRGSDPAFDAACLEVDQVVRLAAISAVEAQAAAGDLRAIRALTDGTLSGLRSESGQKPRPLVAPLPQSFQGDRALQCPCCDAWLLAKIVIVSGRGSLDLLPVPPGLLVRRPSPAAGGH